MHLIKDLQEYNEQSWPVKEVPESLTIARTCSARCISSTALTLQRLPLLHFLYLLVSRVLFLGDTAHAVPYPFLHGTSQASGILSDPTKNKRLYFNLNSQEDYMD